MPARHAIPAQVKRVDDLVIMSTFYGGGQPRVGMKKRGRQPCVQLLPMRPVMMSTGSSQGHPPPAVRCAEGGHRTREGRTRRLTIGRVGTLAPDEARDQAREQLGAVAKGG